jgi:WD40 repeat protein
MGWRLPGHLLLAVSFLAPFVAPVRSQLQESESGRPGADCYGDPLPQGTVSRLGTVRLRHGGNVLSIAFSPDGKTLASAGSDRKIRFWDLATGKEIRQFSARGAISGIAFSPDGRTLALAVLMRASPQPGTTALHDEVLLINPSTGDELRTLAKDEHSGRIRAIAFSPDGRTLALAWGWRLRLWDVPSGKELRECTGHSNLVIRLIEELALPKRLPNAAHQEGWVTSIAFSPGGKVLASGGQDRTIRLWDVAAGREIHRFFGQHTEISSLAFSPNGAMLACAGLDDAVRLWDVANKKEHRQLGGRHGQLHALAFSPDGKTLVTGGADGGLRFWDVPTGKESRHFVRADYLPPSLISFSPDGRSLTCAHWSSPTIELWNVQSGKEVHPSAGHHGWVAAVAFAPDAHTLVSGGTDGTTRIWDLTAKGKTRTLTGHRYGVKTIAFSPDGKLVATGGNDQAVCVYDPATGRQLWRRTGQAHVVFVGFSPDGKTVVSGGADKLCLREASTGKELRQFGRTWYAVALSPDGRILASNSPEEVTPAQGGILLWDIATGRELYRLEGFEGHPHAIAFSPDGKLLAAGSGGENVRVVEVATGKPLRTIPTAGFLMSSLAFSPDHATLAIPGLRPSTLRLWHLPSDTELHPFPNHETNVLSVAFSPDGRFLASGESDTTVLIWGLTAAPKPPGPKMADLTREELEQFWEDLANEDPRRAFPAVWTLAATPRQAIALIRERLRATPPANAQEITRLIGALDSKSFRERQKAFRELETLAEQAEPALRLALAHGLSAERTRSVERLLAKLAGPVTSPEALRALRATTVLEYIGSPDARQVLGDLARGAPQARLTQEAKASRARLARESARFP